MYRFKKTTVKRTKRTDNIIWIKQTYVGELNTPAEYNAAYAAVLRTMADKIEKVKDAWVDPQVVIWCHVPGVITAEVPMSEKV
jgi:hypothetical protein